MIYPDWPAPPGVHAVTTTREGGVSTAPYDSLNPASHVGDRSQAVQQNRWIIQQRLHLPNQPAWLNQVHGELVVAAAGAGECPTADASYTDQRQVVCAVLTADCLPVLFCDRDGSRVAAAHAGWRGLAGGVLESTVKTLGTEPGQLMAWLGPAIGPDAFEVGADVRDAFIDLNSATIDAFSSRAKGRWLADIYHLARIRLHEAGVTAIYGGGFCTFTDEKRFFSYRRDGVTGRMASLIWLS